MEQQSSTLTMGRRFTVSNPYRNTSDPTYGVTENQFDALGRIVLSIPADGTDSSNNVSAAYLGNCTTVTDQAGKQRKSCSDALGRLTNVYEPDSLGALVNETKYQYDVLDNLIQVDQYGNDPNSAMWRTRTFTYNARMQLATLVYKQGTTEHFKLTYGYGTANNGQIRKITDHKDSTRTIDYTYDAWSRLKTAVNGQYNLSWDYDRFGNRRSQDANPGVGVQLTVDDALNQVTQIGLVATEHDASGNMTKDDLKRYTFDAEGRITEVKSLAGAVEATYYYNGNALRMKKVVGSTTTRYIYSGTKVMAEYVNGVGVNSPTTEYVYSGSKLLITLNGSTPTYHHNDHLSTRLTTDSAGNVVGTQGHYPFGEPLYSSGASDKWKFTNYERDSESSLDYATFRFDSWRLGRFMSPDLIAGSIADPLSLNRYAYTRNDPVNLVDPLGLFECFVEVHATSEGISVGSTLYCIFNVNDAPVEPPNGGETNGGKGAAVRIILTGKCAELVNKILANLLGLSEGTPPPPGSDNIALAAALRGAKVQPSGPSAQFPTAPMFVQAGTNTINVVASNLSSLGGDVALGFVHEAFHLAAAPGGGASDFRLATAIGHKFRNFGLTSPIVDRKKRIGIQMAASAAFTKALQAACGEN